MKILALDADTRFVGYALGDGDYREGSQVDFSRKGEVDARCRAILSWFTRLLTHHRPDLVAIEEPVGGKNVKTAIQLGRLGGYLEATAILFGAKVMRVHPSEVKAALAHGRANKEEMIRAAQLAIGQAVVGHHHADAIGALCAAQSKLKFEEV